MKLSHRVLLLQLKISTIYFLRLQRVLYSLSARLWNLDKIKTEGALNSSIRNVKNFCFTSPLILPCLLLIYYYFLKQNFGFCFISVIIRLPSFSLESVPLSLQAYLIKGSDLGSLHFPLLSSATFKVPFFLRPQPLTFTMSVSLIGSQIKTPPPTAVLPSLIIIFYVDVTFEI